MPYEYYGFFDGLKKSRILHAETCPRDCYNSPMSVRENLEKILESPDFAPNIISFLSMR
jgi:hypothetical protein